MDESCLHQVTERRRWQSASLLAPFRGSLVGYKPFDLSQFSVPEISIPQNFQFPYFCRHNDGIGPNRARLRAGFFSSALVRGGFPSFQDRSQTAARFRIQSNQLASTVVQVAALALFG